MNEERTQVLEMLAAGKLSVAEAEMLLSALSGPGGTASDPDPMTLKAAERNSPQTRPGSPEDSSPAGGLFNWGRPPRPPRPPRGDDAAVYQMSDDLALVQTVDFFPPGSR